MTLKRERVEPVSGAADTAAAVMKRDWDERARENARWYINTLSVGQSEEEFDLSGRRDFDGLVGADLSLLTDGRDPGELRLLEIGCGIGRMSRYLAETFGEVEALDVSGEMVSRARERLAGMQNLRFHESNGIDLALFDDESFDVVFCAYVFQHVPSDQVIDSYIREAFRVLRPRGIFKFVTNAVADAEYLAIEKNTWSGVTFPESRVRALAHELGAQLLGVVGDGTQYCWTILRKRAGGPSASGPARIAAIGRAENLEETSLAPRTETFYIGLIVEGLTVEEVDADSLTVVIDGQRLVPCYAGPRGTTRLAPTPNHDSIQINLLIPGDLPAGDHQLSVETADGRTIGPATLRLPPVTPTPPRIVAITNGLDGGLDIEASGPKSNLRVLVGDLSRSVTVEEIAVFLNGRERKVAELRYLVGNGMWEIALDAGPLDPGELSIVVHAGQLESSPPAKCQVSG